MTIFSGRGLEEELSKVHATLSTTGGSGDWKQRIEVIITKAISMYTIHCIGHFVFLFFNTGLVMESYSLEAHF